MNRRGHPAAWVFWFGSGCLGLGVLAHAALVAAMTPYLTPDGLDAVSRVVSQIFGRLLAAWVLGLLVTFGTLWLTRGAVGLTFRDGLTPVLLGHAPLAGFEAFRATAVVWAILSCEQRWAGCASETAHVLTVLGPFAVLATIGGWLTALVALGWIVVRVRKVRDAGGA